MSSHVMYKKNRLKMGEHLSYTLGNTGLCATATSMCSKCWTV